MRERLQHLPLGFACSAVLLVLGAALAWILRGPMAALGAAGGVLLVLVSYTISGLVVAWADLYARQLMMPVVLLTYALKCVLLGLVLYRLNEADWPGLFSLGVAVVVAVFVWTGAQLTWSWRVSSLSLKS
ncbi:hypothetical protein [Actinoplanes sp. TFC3]|uniref:hypothetical protein n=1 Tax=Actinoplanes sp. TFC3 TaxID=1710355 RepID=UPI00082CC4F1|nr:hypothetical protein [Actinoplanes sp. TFC3]